MSDDCFRFSWQVTPQSDRINPEGFALSALPVVLVTRPAEQSRRFAQAILTRYPDRCRVVISPLTELRFLDATLPAEEIGALVFTSETGVAAFARLGRKPDCPAYVVGPRTAEAASAIGLSAIVGPSNGAALADLIIADKPRGNVLVIRGVDVAFDVASALESAGIDTLSLTLYAQEARMLTADAMDLLKGSSPLIVPLFSALGAKRFAELARGALAPLSTVAISAETDAALGDLTVVNRSIARRPTGDSMLDTLEPLLSAPYKG